MAAPTFYFVGGEDSDFTSVGTVAVDTTSTFRRSTYSRCALKVAAASLGDSWNASLSSAVSTCWATARVYFTNDGNVASSIANRTFAFIDGSTPRLALTCSPVNFQGTTSCTWKLIKINAAGTITTLTTSSFNVSPSSVQKIDVFVNYAVAGQFSVYLDGTLIANYLGDVTTDSATTLSNLVLGTPMVDGANGATYWSECIVSDSDTRSMTLATLPVNVAGNSQLWTGANTDINETTLSDATAISTTTAAQLSEWTITPASAIGSTTPIAAVVVSARAANGSTGPQNLQGVVRTGAADFTSSNISGMTQTLAPRRAIWTTNPNTTVAWVGSDLTAAGLNIGLKSIT